MDPLADSATARRDSLAWLRGQLASRGFRVAIVGAGEAPLADLERAAAGVSAGDAVVVHVSGRLEGHDSLAMGRAGALPLRQLNDLLAARSAGYVSFILDLLRDERSGEEGLDNNGAATVAAQSLGAQERGYSVLASVRSTSDSAGRMGFTRRAMPPFDYSTGPWSGEALAIAMHEHASLNDLSGAGVQSGVLLLGAPDPTIDGLIAAATSAGDWPRVVELRLERAETLPSVGQRLQELSGIARILRFELHDVDGAIEVLERARALDPKRAAVQEALTDAYEASGRAPPIDPAEYVKAFSVHEREGQTDAALLDAMVLEELGVAEPDHKALVERHRTVGPVQILKPLDDEAWGVLRAEGFDDLLGALLTAVHDAAVTAGVERMKSSRRLPSLDPGRRLDDESTVSAVRTFHWAARVLGVVCPDLYAGADDAEEPMTQVPGKRPAIVLAPGVLSGTSTKQLAFLAGSCLTWHVPAYHCLLFYPTLEELTELVHAALGIARTDGAPARLSFARPSTASQGGLQKGLARHLGEDARAALSDAATRLEARGEEWSLERWIRSAELTAARAGLFLCGELKTAVAGMNAQTHAPGRPTADRVRSDLLTFCASRGHAELRARWLTLPSHPPPPASPGP